MDILRLTLNTLDTAPNSGDLFSMAKAAWIITSSTQAHLYITEKAQSNTKFNGQASGGTGAPALNVQPDFYPVATKGAEAGCIVSTLSWADNNLEEGYEWVFLEAGKYFVSGVMNSSQTLANDPFDAAKGGDGIIDAACWASTYRSGVNPFV